MNYNIYNPYYQQNNVRILNTDVISVPFGYNVEVFAQGLDTPIGMVFDEEGDLLIADSGLATDNPKVLKLTNGSIEIIADNFNTPISGINYLNGDIYVSHRGTISVIGRNGTRNDIINGLPSFGDFINNRVEFSYDNKIYFGQGTATNSGVVGLDNDWIFEYPYFHDIPGSPIILRKVNFETNNVLIPASSPVLTGSFSPFGSENRQDYEMLLGDTRASGSILRANLDGSDLTMVAWGFRNPFRVKFDSSNQLIISNQSMESRGSRPVANAPDTLSRFIPGAWYGWPDYVAGESVDSHRFTPSSGIQPEKLLETIPSVPPRPIARFAYGSNIMGFDFNHNPDFGPLGDAYVASFGRTYYGGIAEYTRSGIGHRVNRVNMRNGEITTFLINRSGFPESGGFGRPTDVVFGPDGAMYLSDLGFDTYDNPNIFYPGGGVIWRITKV